MSSETIRSKAARWSELDRRQRRREVTRTLTAVAVTWVFLFGIYYLVPFADRTSWQSLVRLVLAIAAFAVVLAWQARRVSRADLPGLQAVQALGGAIPLFLVVFAAFYLSLSQASTTHFSEPLNHTERALPGRHRVLHRGLRRHHAQGRPRTHRRQHPDAPRPRGHRSRRPPPHHRGQVRLRALTGLASGLIELSAVDDERTDDEDVDDDRDERPERVQRAPSLNCAMRLSPTSTTPRIRAEVEPVISRKPTMASRIPEMREIQPQVVTSNVTTAPSSVTQ